MAVGVRRNEHEPSSRGGALASRCASRSLDAAPQPGPSSWNVCSAPAGGGIGTPEYLFAVMFVDLGSVQDGQRQPRSSGRRPTPDRDVRRVTGALRRDDLVSRPATTDPQDFIDNTLARLGGDEFTILLDDIRDPSDAVRVAERIQQAVRAPVSMGGGQEVFATASIGIAISASVNSSDEDLVRDADIAMYRAKASGGDQCAVFDATTHERAVERLQLETDLRRAIEREEFRLRYQPIVSLRDHRVIGFEALIRWQHRSGDCSHRPPSSRSPRKRASSPDRSVGPARGMRPGAPMADTVPRRLSGQRQREHIRPGIWPAGYRAASGGCPGGDGSRPSQPAAGNYGKRRDG